MEQNEILEKIQSYYNHFTKAEKKIADYILSHSHEVLYMSITELSDAVNVGDTSVFRFCRTLQFKGYQEFKMRLSMGSYRQEKKMAVDAQNNSHFDMLKENVANLDIAAVHETMQLLEESNFQKAMEALLEAENIWFFGAGNSMITALDAFNKFLRITPKVHFVQDVHMQSMAASLMTERDVAVIISYSGSTKDMVQIAKTVKESGSRTIAITRFLRSPLTAFADVILLCSSMEAPLQSGSISSKISQLFLIDMLYNAYYNATFSGSQINNEKVTNSVMGKIY